MMDTITLEQAYYIAELVATLAIITSLIYVAVQIRQNTHAVKLSSAQNLSHELRESLGLLASDADLSDIHLRAMRDIDSLAAGEKFRFYIFLNNVFRVYENAYYQKTQRTVDPSVWAGMQGNMNATKLTSGYQAFWRDRKSIFSSEFQEFYDNEVAGNPDLLAAFE
jgi:hypothetical protein